FVNLSGDPAQEYFSDAMTDEIITALASLAPEQLAVIARTTAMHYKGSHKDVARIGRELGVDYLVEGGVNWAGDQIVVNVQLIRSNDQAHMWAHRYVAELTDIFKVYDLAAHSIASHVGVAPVPAKDRGAEPPRRKPTEDLAAYNEYIQGRYHFANLSPQALARAVQHFEEAIRRDPNFALAHDSLAEMYWHMAFYGFMPPQEAFSSGVRHALRALEIDNAVAETHSLLALYHKLDYNWAEVEREMALARALDPTSVIIRTRYAINALVPLGRLEEAAAELEAALELDPLSTYARTLYALVFAFWRRYERAIEEARRLLEIDPDAYWGYLAIGSANRELRRFDEAIAAYRKAVELSAGSAAMLGWLGMTLGLSGNKAEARSLLKRLHEMAKQGYVPPTSFAWIHLGLGEIDATFEWLDRAVDARDQLAAAIKTYPFLDPIRCDPRFRELLRRMNLPE
ncbi:MAG TPA: tetratricopeptide repeat protein, partial [Candidatus Acidoferrales bacterium]|nr:tetratricopeptide repeat protein [Candidatus Acidoferrales bacterium]